MDRYCSNGNTSIWIIEPIFLLAERMNNDRWSRLREALNLTWTTPYGKLLHEIRSLEDNGLFCRTWAPITDTEMEKLQGNNQARMHIRNFLDHLEEIAAGQKLKVFDEKFFDSIWSSILRKNFIFFQPLIIQLRAELGQSDLYSDLAEVVVCLEKKELNKKKK